MEVLSISTFCFQWVRTSAGNICLTSSISPCDILRAKSLKTSHQGFGVGIGILTECCFDMTEECALRPL